MQITGTIVNSAASAANFIIAENPNASPARCLRHISARIAGYPIRIAYCSDEKTGRRFGRAAIRRDKHPEKIGSGGRNRGNIGWQLWTWDV